MILFEPKKIKRQITVLAAQADEVRKSLLPGGISYEADRVQGGGGSDRYADAMARIDEIEREMIALAKRYDQITRDEIPQLLQQLDELERAVVYLHDIAGHKMDDVSAELYISIRTAWRIRGKAIKKLKAGTLGTLDL